jgi:aminoglycoside/choline kinase family phosphotransferase
MPPEQQALLILTCDQFPHLRGVPCEMEAIVKGGSDRHYYRLCWPGVDQVPMILMVYTLARSDNARFVPATRRLAELGVHVPELYLVDESRLCIWLQDLGRMDLHGLRLEPWAVLRGWYEKALREVAKVHAVGERQVGRGGLAELERPFDEGLYHWEQEYFLDHVVRTHWQWGQEAVLPLAVEQCLRDLRGRLAGLPRCLVHRDFQSQNILIHGGETWLVDYQGLRLGLAEYDLASLLFDPYAQLTRSQREELLHFYAELRGVGFARLREVFLMCAAQRLMQALGAYANLSRNQGKMHFLQYLPVATERLLGVCEEADLLRPLADFLLQVRPVVEGKPV